MFLWAKYLNALSSYPIPAKMATSGVLMAFGDVICQWLSRDEQKPLSIDCGRVARVTSHSTLFVGPGLHFWYPILESRLPGTAWPRVFAKVFFDQAIFAPAVVSSFFVWVNLLEGRPWAAIVRKFKDDFAETMKANYVLWPAANVINYKFMPIDLRILFISGVALVWNVYLSHQQHKSHKPKAVV